MSVSPLDESYLQSITEEPWKTQIVAPLFVNEDVTAVSLETLELSIRSQLWDLMETGDDDSMESRVDPIGDFWTTTVQVCTHLVHFYPKEQTAATTSQEYSTTLEPSKLPFVVLEDCLEGLSSLRHCQYFWTDYVEPLLFHATLGLVTSSSLFWRKQPCRLAFLKVCNWWMRKLQNIAERDDAATTTTATIPVWQADETNSSTSLVIPDLHHHHQVWKGRILSNLSKGFGVSDRSGLKLWGTFRRSQLEIEGEESTTEDPSFETKAEYLAAQQQNGQTLTSSPSKKSKKTDGYTLYEALWSLQSDFGNPNQLQFAGFIQRMKLVMESLESSASSSSGTAMTTKHNRTNGATTDAKQTKQEMATDQLQTQPPHCQTVEYLTSSSLLPIHLQQEEFRSGILTQFLIVASHLSSESPSLAKALSSLQKRARLVLQQDNPPLHHLLVGLLLPTTSNNNTTTPCRESQWRQWKKNKCPAAAFAPKFAKEATSNDNSKKSMSLNGSSLSLAANADDEKVYDMVDEKELLAISKDLQKSIPTIEEHLETYVEALDPESGIEEEYHPKNDSLFAWRAMRLYSKHHLCLLKECQRPDDLERITRLLYSSKGKDIPGEMPPEHVEEEEEEQVEDASQEDDEQKQTKEEELLETTGAESKEEQPDDDKDAVIKEEDPTEEGPEAGLAVVKEEGADDTSGKKIPSETTEKTKHEAVVKSNDAMLVDEPPPPAASKKETNVSEASKKETDPPKKTQFPDKGRQSKGRKRGRSAGSKDNDRNRTRGRDGRSEEPNSRAPKRDDSGPPPRGERAREESSHRRGNSNGHRDSGSRGSGRRDDPPPSRDNPRDGPRDSKGGGRDSARYDEGPRGGGGRTDEGSQTRGGERSDRKDDRGSSSRDGRDRDRYAASGSRDERRGREYRGGHRGSRR